MNPARKQGDMSLDASISYTFGTGIVARQPFPPEAYDYSGDISPADVARLQEQADAVLGEGEWEVIDGYVGKK
jgi:hypothetical protein